MPPAETYVQRPASRSQTARRIAAGTGRDGGSFGRREEHEGLERALSANFCLRTWADLPDVAVRNLVAHQCTQLFELRVGLAIDRELHRVALGAQRLRSRAGGRRRERRGRGYQ